MIEAAKEGVFIRVDDEDGFLANQSPTDYKDILTFPTTHCDHHAIIMNVWKKDWCGLSSVYKWAIGR